MKMKIALIVAFMAIVGVLAIKTITMATTIGTIHCIYANKTNCETPPAPIPVPEDTNKEVG